MRGLILSFVLFVFAGCGGKTIYKEVKIPVACNVEIPNKPENNGTFESHKEILKYFLKCESLLKFCVKEQ